MPIFPTLPGRAHLASAANTALTVSTVPVSHDRKYKLVAVYVAYSAGIAANLSATVTLNSGIAAAYDTRLATIDLVAGQRWGVYVPPTPLPLGLGDTIDAVAPAGGAGVTSAVQILFEEERPLSESQGWDYDNVERE